VSGRDLLARTADLVAVPSVSRDENALAAAVAAELSSCDWLEVERFGDNVVGRTTLGRPLRLVIAGHLDTVPPAGNERPRIVGDSLYGIGACDMKGGLAVMLDLATSVALPAVDVTWCFYACEEIERRHNGLGLLWRDRPDLLRADAAILAEPTDARVEAGCQGSLRAVVHIAGVRAHTARPFAGRNAIHRMAPVLARVSEWRGREVVIDGCTFVEQLQAVAVAGGVAGNVVPDHATLTVHHRFAPDRVAAEAHAGLAELFSDQLDAASGDRLEVVDEADGAPPALSHPLLSSLVDLSGAPPKAKLGWTDVATMWAHGVPAANFGPGDPILAHHPDEHVTEASLARVRSVLATLVNTPLPAASAAGGDLPSGEVRVDAGP